MGQIFNYEANLQVITDILGFGGYDTLDGQPLQSKPKLTSQPDDINLYLSADDMLIPPAVGSGMSQRLTLGSFVHSMNELMRIQYYGEEAPDITY